VFVELTGMDNPSTQKRIAMRATLIAALVLITFAVAGGWVLKKLQISEAALMVAGGMLLFIFAVGRVLSGQGGSRKPSVIELEEAHNKRDVSVFPIAIPLIAGPGAMTVVMFHMKQVSGDWALQLLFIACLTAVLMLMFVLLLSAVRITRVLGVTGTNVITRVFGIILAAMAIQFIMNGIQQFMQQFLNS